MATTFVINAVDPVRGTVALTVTFDDGSTYQKRMMAPLSTAPGLLQAINAWLTDYAPARRPAPTVPGTVNNLIGVQQTHTPVERSR